MGLVTLVVNCGSDRASGCTEKRNGLCPKGFYCPEGTPIPIPSPKGYFSQLEGIVAPTQCRPGYYAPTIQTVECYPCPPGSQCENDGMSASQVCPPGTYRSVLSDEGVMCTGCPQGTWSKNWELRDALECNVCPPGVVCPIDGMTNPCGLSDLPTPWEPTDSWRPEPFGWS